jgi:hypothetical protein
MSPTLSSRHTAKWEPRADAIGAMREEGVSALALPNHGVQATASSVRCTPAVRRA